MITDVLMPQMGLEVTEGTVVEFLAGVGDRVEEGAPVVVISTDKADADVAAPREGVIREILVELEQNVAIGEPLMRIADSAEESVGGQPPVKPAPAEPFGDAPPRIRVAPIARRAAARLGVKLTDVEGSGPNGRVTLKDVERTAADRPEVSAPASAPTPAPTPPATGFEAFTPLRRAVAQRMATSQLVPQYQLTRAIDMGRLIARKGEISVEQPDAGIGVNDLLMKALGETVRRHPRLAALFSEESGTAGLAHRGGTHVGLAVATDGGLLVPVVKDVADRPLAEIAAERRALTAKAREGSLRMDELADGVITLSNLGGFGIDSFTAMVNPGQSSILAVGRTEDRLVPVLGGTAVIPTMVACWTFDHRVLDGADGAVAFATLAGLLEGAMDWTRG